MRGPLSGDGDPRYHYVFEDPDGIRIEYFHISGGRVRANGGKFNHSFDFAWLR